MSPQLWEEKVDREELGSAVAPPPRLGGGRRDIVPQEKEEGDRLSSEWAQMGPDVWMAHTNGEFSPAC